MTGDNQWLSTTRSIPYWTTSVFSSAWVTWFWFTNRSLVQLPLSASYHSTAEHWTIELPSELSYEWISWILSLSHITTDGQSVSKSWYRVPSGAYDQIFITVWQLRSCLLWGALSDKRTGLSFLHSAGPCQCSLSRVRVLWYSRPYFTVSDLSLPFSSPPTTRRIPWIQSQSHIATDGQSVTKSWCRAPFGARDEIFITVWQLRSCFCEALSLTRGRVCLLYMLLALASAADGLPSSFAIPAFRRCLPNRCLANGHIRHSIYVCIRVCVFLDRDNLFCFIDM
jgi:hypothetical protein